MATYNFQVDLTKQPLPAQIGQRRVTALFSNTPGDSVVPYPYWVRNAIPTARGIKAVAWSPVSEIPELPVGTSPAKMFYFPVVGAGYQLGAYANNKFYLFDVSQLAWGAGVVCPMQGVVPTTAFVQGQSLVFIPGVGLKKVTQTGLEDVALNWGAGVTPPTDLVGCSACQGYLVLFSKSRVYYSSPTNYTTFSISEGGVSTGAGSTNIQGLAGAIVTVAPVSGGAIVYASQNAASMRYTGNPAVPFTFGIIVGFPGVVRDWHIGIEPSNQYHFVWTVRGLHRVNSSESQPILSEITEAISKDLLVTSNGFDVITEVSKLDVKLALIGVEELVISVGKKGSPFQYAWVLNLALGRLGRIDIPHWDFHPAVPLATPTAITLDYLIAKGISYEGIKLFTYEGLSGDLSTSSETPLEFQVLGADGKVYLSDWANTRDLTDSYVLIGDVALTLGKLAEINKVTLRGVDASVTIRSNFGREVEFTPYKNGEFLGRISGNYLTIKLSGNFELSDVVVALTVAGEA